MLSIILIPALMAVIGIVVCGVPATSGRQAAATQAGRGLVGAGRMGGGRLIERSERATQAIAPAPARDERMLIPLAIEEVGAIEVAHNGILHRFERDTSGAWFYHGIHTGNEQQHVHTSDPDTAARIATALAGFGRARMERQFPLNVQNDEFAVTRPEIFIMVYRPGAAQPLSRYAGRRRAGQLSRYVLPVGNAMSLPSRNFISTISCR